MPGPIDLDLTPYLREPLRAVQDPDVEDIVLCTSSQVAKTTFMVIVSLHTMATEPWNQLVVMPTEDDARELNLERYQPIIMASPELSRFVAGMRGEFVMDAIRLNGATITFRGSNSPAGLSSKPGKILIADEIDKWPIWSGREASPLDLLGERAKTFHDSKFLMASTPTTPEGLIWRELQDSSNARYHVPCPYCGTYQILEMGGAEPGTPGIKWPRDERNPNRIVSERLAWYECAACAEKIRDHQKPGMVKNGRWVPAGQKLIAGELVGPSPPRRRVGFHLWAGYGLWPKSSFSQIAARFLQSKDVPSRLQNFRNSWQGEVWRQALDEVKDAHLRACVGEYHQGAAPAGAWLLTAGIDVQSREEVTYLYFVLRAWGRQEESWLVRAGIAEGWGPLYQILFQSRYEAADGAPIPLRMAVVDSGYRTDEVYEFCRRSGCFAYKGAVRAQRHLTIKGKDVSGANVPFALANPDFFKARLHRLIREPGKFHLPEDLDEEYFSHLVAEQQVLQADKKTGRMRIGWKLLTENRPNHYFDAEVMALVAADILEVSNLAKEPPRGESKPGPDKPDRRARRTIERIFS
jgi:phage terminase large subunit GpA-like protein